MDPTIQVLMECHRGTSHKFYRYTITRWQGVQHNWRLEKNFGRIGTTGRKEVEGYADLYDLADVLVASVRMRYDHHYAMAGHSPQTPEGAAVVQRLDQMGRGLGGTRTLADLMERTMLRGAGSTPVQQNPTTTFADYLIRLEGGK